MSTERYRPCRISECFLDENDTIEITSKKGLVCLSGALKSVWYMLDGKNTIDEILRELCQQLNIVDYDSLEKELGVILKQLEEKEIIIMNWDPIYKFDKMEVYC